MAQPLCPYFNECGGCSLQHVEYGLQLENKRNYLAKIIKSEDIKVFSDIEYHYRNRLDMKFHKGGLGFRKKFKWDVIIDIDNCVIGNENLNVLIKEVRDFFKNSDYFDMKKQTGTYKYAVIRTPSDDSSISFVLNEDSSRLSEAIEEIRKFAKVTTAKNIIVTYSPRKDDHSVSSEFFTVKGRDFLEEKLLGKTFDYSVQGFFQNNTVMAGKMQKYVNELLSRYDTKNAHLLDLYGGVGTFGIINADLFKTTLTVESVKECIDAANKNIEMNKANAKALVMDAMKIRKLELQKPLYVINDPPRSGMHLKTIEALNYFSPEVIVYISCNPEQLGKELPKFKNYEVKSAALFDLFPQTNHSEAVIELVKKK